MINDNQQVDKSPERIAGMFDRIAPRYDFLNHFLSLGIDRSWRKKTVRQLVKRLTSGNSRLNIADLTVLDVAAGTADLTIQIARELNRRNLLVSPKQGDSSEEGEKPILGVDFSAEMLKIGAEKVQKAGLANQIALRQADGMNLPLADGSFSAVTIAFGLRNMADTDRGLAEMVRVSRPEGWVLVLEFSIPNFPGFAPVYRFYFRRVLPLLGAFFSRKSDSAYRYLPESVAQFDRIPAMKERMKKAGLTEIAAIPFTFGVAVLYLGKKPSACGK